MYSVIILTKETMDDFSTYRSIFTDAIHSGHLGFCIWNKLGKDIDEALPDIRELTDNKKEWSAIVVCSNPNKTDELVNGKQNPFDYFSDNPENESDESSNPLIRLTHMLGGVPQPERQFKSTIIREPYKEPRMVYEPVEDTDRDNAYNTLKQKYEFDGVPPTSISLISPRNPWRQEEDIFEDCKTHLESKSSEFWKRNRYPSSCRFLVFDFEKKGPVRKEADLFRFWLTVMTFASNKIDSSSFQAYRLYNINTVFDLDRMEGAFQLAVNRTCSAKTVIKNDLQNELQGFENKATEIPDFTIDVPVDFELPKNTKCTVKHNSFRLISNNAASDIGTWNTEKIHAEESLIKSIRTADRALDQTANRMKGTYTYDESEVARLDKYQMEDIELETDLLYRRIIDVQGRLPSSNLSNEIDLEEKSDEIKEYLRGRVTLSPVMQTFIMGSIMIIAAQIPAVVQHFIGETISWTLVAMEVVTFICVMLLCGFTTLILQKSRLNALIGDFNRMMQGVFSKLQNNAGEYSKYLGAIASHSRGRSYMHLAAKKNMGAVSFRALKYKHLSAIDLFISRLKTWGEAYHLDIDFERPEINEGVAVDITIPPADNPLYSLESGVEYDVEVNKTGMKIQTPFDFISRFMLVREELYDDDSL